MPCSETSGLNAIATQRGQSPRTKSARRRKKWVLDLGPIKWQQERSPYRAYRAEFDDMWPWLDSK
eukprot:2282877-Pyramimonas_sp.AAC.1